MQHAEAVLFKCGFFLSVDVNNRQRHECEVSVTAAEWTLGDISFDTYIYSLKLDMKTMY